MRGVDRKEGTMTDPWVTDFQNNREVREEEALSLEIRERETGKDNWVTQC
jgi:hypothetical protein